VPVDILIPDGPPGTYRVTGVVDGLFGTLVLEDNGNDDKPVMSSDGKGVLFFFDTTLPPGASYDVKVKSAPTNFNCTVANGQGTVGMGNVMDIVVNCVGDPGIRCGTGYCALGDSCCVATGVCNSVTACASLAMPCDDTADCTGGICCAELNGGGQVVQRVVCEPLATCQAVSHYEVLCDPGAPGGDSACTASQMCLATSKLSGYHSCQP
jgi:hypothetical protein